MSPLLIIRRSLVYHRRIHLAVAAGVMVATAVLVGALLVGDSMRGSLRQLAFNRLCGVEQALVGPAFFRHELADEVAADLKSQKDERNVAPLIMLQATITATEGDPRPTAPKVNLLGLDDRGCMAIWKNAFDGKVSWTGSLRYPQSNEGAPRDDEIILNRELFLRLESPREVIVRLPQLSEIPADSPLGKKSGAVPSLRLKVGNIVPSDYGLGAFSLQLNQQTPINAVVSLATLQQASALDRPGQVNGLVVFTNSKRGPGDESPQVVPLHPKLADYGLHLTRSPKGYFNLTSDRMMLADVVEKAVAQEFAAWEQQPTFTYLANYITGGDGKAKIPYSTITALEPLAEPPLGPLETTDGQPLAKLADDEIALNSWAADDMRTQGVDLKAGDEIELTYFDPESTHGRVTEHTAKFRLKAIVKLAGAAADADFTPELKGVSDRKSIRNWTPPFPYDSDRVRSSPPNSQDDDYWKRYKTTPKGFISLSAGRKLWGSRFGQTTTIRLAAREPATPTTEKQADGMAQKLAESLDPTSLGLELRPVRQQALAAAAGTTEFNQLFIGFSFFIILSALMLVAILFRLGIEQRAAEIGLLLAVGVRRRRVRWILLAEGAVVATLGAAGGVIAGLGYGWLMLVGLNTLWGEAISRPFVMLHVTASSILIGFASGLIVSLLTILYALRQLSRVPNRRLLAGQVGTPSLITPRSARLPLAIAVALLALAAGLGVFARTLGGEAQAGAFFGAGFVMLAAGMTLVWLFLRRGETLAAVTGRAALTRLAVRNAGRNPGRSTLSVGLMAAATFLIVAIGAFHLDPPSQQPVLESGDGGFALWAETDQPLHQNILQPQEGLDPLLGNQELAQLKGVEIYPLRAQAGDDASCLNLYQPRQPRVIGVSEMLVKRGGFAWQAVMSDAEPAAKKNPWRLLERELPAAKDAEQSVPVILDANTAMYSLHLFGGPGETFEIVAKGGKKVQLQIVALLENSLFQGDVLMSEENLLRLFPEVSGYRTFLIAAPSDSTKKAKETLESALSDYGFAAERTSHRLERFAAVQNTYLSTFQSLGGLGLLLGTFGLATVQLRSVLERRGELALLRATGFRRRRLAEMVMLENSSLLIGGLAIGVAAAAVAVAPQLFGGRAHLPWALLCLTLGLVLLVGLAAGLLAVRATLHARLLPALRGE